MVEENKIVTLTTGRWSSKEPNVTSLPMEVQLCNHQNFKRTMVIVRKDGTTDWKGKCKDCQKSITLKKVYFKSCKTETDDCGATQTLQVSARQLS